MPISAKTYTHAGIDLTDLCPSDIKDVLTSLAAKAVMDVETYVKVLESIDEFCKGDYRVRILPKENCTEVITKNYCYDIMTVPEDNTTIQCVIFDNRLDDELFSGSWDIHDAYAERFISYDFYMKMLNDGRN